MKRLFNRWKWKSSKAIQNMGLIREYNSKLMKDPENLIKWEVIGGVKKKRNLSAVARLVGTSSVQANCNAETTTCPFPFSISFISILDPQTTAAE